MARSKKVAELTGGCVACGSCAKACPISAMSVYKGLYANVDSTKCVGCGRCVSACPAGIIQLRARGEDDL